MIIFSNQDLLCGGGLYKILETTKRMVDADVVTNSVTRMYCVFIGKILKIQNKSNSWYEICNGSGARVYRERDKYIVTCTKCAIEDISFTKKYLLRLIVSYGNQEVYIAIFDVAKSFIGCTMTEYVEALLKKVPKANFLTCVRDSLTRRVVNRGMCTSGRDLRERANMPTPRTDLYNISVKNLPHTEIELALPKNFFPHHLRPYQLA
ncbi:Replication factor-A C terminal domain-containing protein [Forsythia ovata]|uniref:Replication factor-A C terminal domain-containing protein n=1 Tax=Forsythia ovata TaxID=205694 RepID=A0ABD1S6U1_9LAMI